MKNITLKNYGKIIVEVTDNLENAIAIIKYVDHGDEFLVVKTEDGIYEYGWFLNRHGYPDYNILVKNPDRYIGENTYFISTPKLYYKEDYHSQAANEIFFCTEDLTTWGTERYEWIKKHHRYDFYKDPQRAFDSYMDDIKQVYDGKNNVYGNSYYGHTYHFNGLDDIERFLKKHSIYDENTSKLDILKKYFRVDEIDGSAGIRNACNCVIGDEVLFIIHRGKNVDLNDIKIDNYEEEEYGLGEFDRFSLNVDQFE